MILDDFKPYHSKFQIENFIIKKSGGTKYGQYLQTLRELKSRLKILKEEYFKLKELEDKLSNSQDWKALKIKNDIYELKFSAKDIEREYLIFLKIAIALKKELGEINKDKLDKEMWIIKIKTKMAIDYMTINNLSKDTIEMISTLDYNEKETLLKDKKIVDWYLKKEDKLPKYENIEIPREELICLRKLERNYLTY